MEAQFITGGSFSDHRGLIDFVNEFDLTSVKRFYAITHPNTTEVRAWQGHQVESKWFYCSKGSFLVQLVKIDDWENPSDNLVVEKYILKAEKPTVLYVPFGYANGLQALKEDSQILVFSDFSLEDSLREKMRFDKNKWTQWH